MTESLRQQYHLEPDRGLLNDPNGLSWFNGKYRVYFQWNRLRKDHSYKEWGAFTSKDLLNWEFEGSAIVPNREYDREGVYSGSGYVIGNKLYLFYTGNSKEYGQRKSSQCLAVTDDGIEYHKKGIVLTTPKEYTEHFRDPKVFPGKSNDYFMLIGGQRKNGKGALALCHSTDGECWDYKSMPAISEEYEMIECPDMFEIDGQTVLLFNPQKRDNATDEPEYSFSAYKLEDLDVESGLFLDKDLDHGFEKMDAGFDFYAPQTFLGPDGRRILFAWMSRMEEVQEKEFSKTTNNIHCMTLPRELYLKDSKLLQKPLRELYQLLGQQIAVKKTAHGWKASPKKRTFYLHVQKEEIQDLKLLFHQGESKIEYSQVEKTLSFYRRNWIDLSMEVRSSKVDTLRDIEIWSDHSSMELFVNDGERVFSARIFPETDELELEIRTSEENIEIQMYEIDEAKKEEK